MLIRLDVEYCSAKGLFQGKKRVNSLHCPVSRANRITQACTLIEARALEDWDDPEAILRFIGLSTVQACTL